MVHRAEADLGNNVKLGANLGPTVDTGVDFGLRGVRAKVAGFGISLGCTNEICTIFGCITLNVC